MKLIICALKSELSKTLKFYQPLFLERNDRFELYQKDDWLFAICHIGQVNAAMALTKIIMKYQISEIYNLGTAGSLKQELQIFDIVYVEKTKYLFADVTVFGYEIGQIPNLNEYFTSETKLINNIKAICPQAIKSATLGTCDIFATNAIISNPIMQKHQNKIDMIDMEGAALFQVAEHFSIPIVSIKIISDMIKQPKNTINDFQTNLEKISELIKNLIIKLIENLA